jgi:toxin ParE1/3/4
VAVAERRVSFHPAALIEAETARAWYAERSEPVAQLFSRQIDSALQQIRQTPERWPRIRGSVRRYLLRRFPFDIIYTVDEESIDIIAFAHHRRRPGFWASRT